MASNSLKRGLMPMEEHLLLKEMHMKNSITITPSKPNAKHDKTSKKLIEPVRLTPAWEEKNLPNDILNFKSVTMERAELETNPPKDRYLMVYFVILIHGIGVLMPWNMFITAKDYFESYKLGKENVHGIDTAFYVTYFMTFLSVFSQLPNVAFNWINIFINFGGSFTSRIVYSIVLELIVFLFTEALVIIDSSTWPHIFFWVTMASVFFLNVVNGIYQNTIYGIAARLPPAYTGAIILGNNISGIFAAIINIITKGLSPSPKSAAIYYFVIALFVLFVCFDTYFILPLTKFYKYHDLQFQKAQEKNQIAAEENNTRVKTSYWKIFKTCSLQCFNVFYIFLITLTIFPAMQSNVKSLNPDVFIVSPKYFADITCFLTFSVFATLGNLVSTFVMWPGPDKLHIPVLLRTVFVPLIFFCNYQVDGRTVAIFIQNDYVYWIISMIFSFTGGYFSSLAMMYCGKTVAAENSSIAGMFGAACLVSGVFAGIVLAFVWPVIATL